MRIELLKWVVSSSLAAVGPQYPHGYCYAPKEQLVGCNELMGEGMVTAYPANAQADGSFPVMPTAQGVAAAAQPAPLANVPAAPQPQSAPQSAPQPAQPHAVVIDDNVPLPAAASRGFQAREGGNAVDRYGFANLAIGQSFHLPPSTDPDKSKATHRVFSSTVSQANTKLHPKAFTVREVGADDPRGPGARVFRIADMTGPRPTRKPREKAAGTPAATAPQAPEAAPQGWPAPGQAQGQGGGFPAPGGFAPPAGFAPPGAAPQGFGQPFPENAPPVGFGTAGPSFGQ